MAIKIDGFKTPSKEVKHRLIIASHAHERRGKTHFGLTMPGPLAVIPLDTGIEGVIEKFGAEKELLIPNVDLTFEAGGQKSDYVKVWDNVVRCYEKCLKTKGLRSLLIDTGSELWELLRLARFGKLTQVMPHQYGVVNEEFRKFIRMAYDADVNLIITHKVKKQYVGAKDKETWNGKYERSGMSDVGFLTQCTVEHDRDEVTGEFFIRILDCRQNPDIAGKTMGMGQDGKGNDCDYCLPVEFASLAQLVFPDTSEEEWA